MKPKSTLQVTGTRTKSWLVPVTVLAIGPDSYRVKYASEGDSLNAGRTAYHIHPIQYLTTMNTQISFKPDGTAQCLWTEVLPLHELGRLEITRASNIEFNNTTQQWEVKDQKGKVRYIAMSRSSCLEWEQQNLQQE